jgi:hypothetical protein
MSNKTFAVIVLAALVLGLFIQIKQFAMINSGLTIIAANQVKAEANQALGNATLSMIQATAEKSLAMQAAADAAREARP